MSIVSPDIDKSTKVSGVQQSQTISLRKKSPFPPTLNNNYRYNYQVDNILSIFKDLAKPNLFRVTFEPPQGIDMSDDKPVYFCKQVTMPSFAVGKIEIKRAGNKLNIPSDTIYGDVSMTFWNDVNNDVRLWFNKWQHFFLNSNEGEIGSAGQACAGRVNIEQLDNFYNTTYAVRLYNIWPSEVGEITLAHEDADNRETFNVKFEYSYFEIFKGA